jgi:hypothetical protein
MKKLIMNGNTTASDDALLEGLPGSRASQLVEGKIKRHLHWTTLYYRKSTHFKKIICGL